MFRLMVSIGLLRPLFNNGRIFGQVKSYLKGEGGNGKGGGGMYVLYVSVCGVCVSSS